jgi:hypothetical protein
MTLVRGDFAAVATLGRGLHSSTSLLNVSTVCEIRLAASVDIWVTTRHKLNTKRLTDQNDPC